MTQIGNRAGSRIRLLGLLACALAILFCASACRIAHTASGGSPSPAPKTGAAVSHLTPSAALTQWLQLVVRGDYRAACHAMVPPLRSLPSPIPIPPNACSSKSSHALSMLTDLHGNFATDGITPHTPIMVATPHVTGTTATIDGSDIRMSRTTLTSLMLAHSTGAKPGNFSISFTLSRGGGAWYVTGINMGF